MFVDFIYSGRFYCYINDIIKLLLQETLFWDLCLISDVRIAEVSRCIYLCMYGHVYVCSGTLEYIIVCSRSSRTGGGSSGVS